MKRISTSAMLAIGSLAAVLAGCNQSSSEAMGPAERAGKAVDAAGAKVSDAVQKEVVRADAAAREAKDKVKDATAQASHNLDRATEKVGEKVERAGEKIQEAAH